jgi:hypothetical protein
MANSDRYGAGAGYLAGARRTENDGHVFSPTWSDTRDAMNASTSAMLSPHAEPASDTAFRATDATRINPTATTPQLARAGINVPPPHEAPVSSTY